MNVVIQFLAHMVGYFARMDLKQKCNFLKLIANCSLAKKRPVWRASLIKNLTKIMRENTFSYNKLSYLPYVKVW